MHDSDRVKLLFGPSRAPALKRGDRAVCLYRDTTVIITGTVTAHDLHGDTAQTYLSRCRWTPATTRTGNPKKPSRNVVQ